MDWLRTSLLIVLSMSVIVSVLLIWNMGMKFRQTRIKAVFFLVLFFIPETIVKIAEIILLLINTEDLTSIYLDIDRPFPIMFSIAGILGAGAYLFFIDYYESEKLPANHIVVFTAILASFLTFNALKLFNLYNGVEFTAPTITSTPISFDFLPAIMITYLLIIAYPKLYNLIQESEYERKTYALKGLFVSIIFLFIFPSIFVTIANFLTFDVRRTVILGSLIPRITVMTGNIILLATYGRTSPGYLHSQRLEKLLAITRNGIPLYSLDFIDSPTKRDDVLISGSLTALRGLLAESIEVTDLESIEFKEKEVLIKNKQTIGFFLITDRPSQFLWNALNTAADELLQVVEVPDDNNAINKMYIDQAFDDRVKIIFGMN